MRQLSRTDEQMNERTDIPFFCLSLKKSLSCLVAIILGERNQLDLAGGMLAYVPLGVIGKRSNFIVGFPFISENLKFRLGAVKELRKSDGGGMRTFTNDFKKGNLCY